TRGVNVWCAAGKGTFGTDELVNRIRAVGLEKIVSHKKLILPQLSAPGVAAHEVKKQSGFQVVYGPVRSSDIREFLKAGMNTTPEMRQVRFDLVDRLVVVPVEIVEWSPYFFLLGLVMLGLSGLTCMGYEMSSLWTRGFNIFMILLVAFLGGSILGPALLPWLPGTAFSIKGLCVGLALWSILVPVLDLSSDVWAALPLILSITSFMAMNFTGCTTYTSQSGVKREMRYAIPAQILLLVVGMFLWVKFGIV
ncbi:MAG: mercury methylation corrinoid protein HgcA, partial [Kiritimatiellae bacterium]|nr:mercury methylation corrinoid protein HgcA [Kiritimatiellia bacterium]